MKKNQKFKKTLYHLFTWYFFLFFILFSTSVIGKYSFSVQTEMEQALSEAKKYMIAQQGDKALPITKSLLKEIKKKGRYTSHFGFQVRLTHALALFHSSEEVPSLDFLWKLKDESKIHQEWSVFADICREIAKIQEISGQSPEAYQNLQEAKATIEKHHIDSVYSSFAVRYSSWHRVFGDLDTAYFYAQEAIQAAQEHGQIFEEVEGNLLMALVVRNKKGNNLAVVSLIKRAVYLYQKTNTYTSATSMHQNLTKLYTETKNYKEALLHIDTAIHYTTKYLDNDLFYTQNSYKYKGEIFKKLGLMDSAISYLTKGYEDELQFLEKNKHKELVEVDKKYNLEKKNKELKSEKEKSSLLIMIVIIFLVFLLLSLFFYSKLQKANRLTQEQAQELKALDQVKSRFFANISHELRTPLTLILAPIREILAQNQLDKRAFANLTLVEKNTKRLEQMVNEILDISKLDANKMTINTQAIDWHLFLKQTYANFESLADLRKIEFNLDYKNSETLVVTLDRLKMETIFNNLLANAFKFTPTGGKITISAGASNGYLWVNVEDKGRGIFAEDLPYIFNRFYQTKSKIAEGGTGIGLALTQELVVLLKGKIEVESELGKGSIFKLQMPLEKVEASILLETSSSSAENKLVQDVISLCVLQADKTENVLDNTLLLVEDNPDLSLFIQTILGEYYTVTAASNGQEALDQLAQNPSIQLVVSDVMMPVMDGFELLESLKTSPIYKKLPVIMLTARVSLKDKLNALRIGVDDYLTKPFIKEELIARIENLLRNAQGRKEILAYELEEDEVKTETPEPSKEDLEIQEWLDKLEQVVLKNIELSAFTIDDIATEMFTSKRQIYRKIKQHIGITPLQYIKTYKLNYAKELLENKKVNAVKVAAYSIGYPNVAYFRREFKKAFGRVPSDYLS